MDTLLYLQEIAEIEKRSLSGAAKLQFQKARAWDRRLAHEENLKKE